MLNVESRFSILFNESLMSYMKEVAQYAKTIANRSPYRALVDLGRTWLVIGAAIGLFFWAPSWVTFLVAFIIVGAQQYAMLILMHDGQHSLLHPERAINNFVSTWLIAAPCGTPFQSSQKQHLAHHRSLGSPDADPAYHFYCYGEPSSKDTVAHLTMHFLWILSAGRVAYTLLGKGNTTSAEGVKGTAGGARVREYVPIMLCQAAIFLMFATIGFWWAYPVLWVLPLFTLVSFFDAFRQFAEHAQPVSDPTAKTLLISTRSNVFERFFIAPFGMNFHAEHHLFPFVPYYRLSELSKKIRGLHEGAGIEWRRSYFESLIKYVIALKK